MAVGQGQARPEEARRQLLARATGQPGQKTIKPLFTTDFSREYAEIAWGRGKSKVVIEAALDQGFVIAGKRKEEICELELELREGEPQALLELAAELAASLPLMPCDISKAERGYRLLEPDSYELGLPHTELEAEMAVDDAYAALAWQLLGSSQRLAEQYRHNGHWRLLQDWVECLSELRAITASLGQAAPRAITRDLRSSLDALLEDWRPLVQAGNEDEDIRRAAPSSSPKNWKTCAGASSRWKPRAGCWPVPGPWSAKAVASARARRSWQAGWRTCWAKKAER